MRFLPAYPKPRRSNVSETLHNVIIADPYRWMEDPDSEETRRFVSEENAVSKPYIVDDCVHRADMEETLNAVWKYERFSTVRKVGDHYYYFHNTGLQNQSVMYRKKSLDDESAEVFIDPNGLSEDGTISIAQTFPSRTGKYYAIAISKSGSDWRTIHIKKTEDKQDLPEVIHRVRYSNLAWAPDDQGFFYGQYPEKKNEETTGTDAKSADNQKIFYHRIGTEQKDDVLVVEFPDQPKWRSHVEVTDCGTKLLISTYTDLVSNLVYVADIPSKIDQVLPLNTIRGNFDGKLTYVTNEGDTFYWLTNIGRPNYAMVKFDINEPTKWEDVIAEDPKRAISFIRARAEDKLVVGYIQDVSTVVEVFNLKGEQLQKLPFDIGTIHIGGGQRNESEVFFQHESFANPGIHYRCNLTDVPSAKLEEYNRVKLGNWDTEDLTYKQVFYNSTDDARVPMYILHKKNHPPTSASPGLLYVYGGFGASLTPNFNLFNLMLVYTLGYVVAIANVRGGGEYGKGWHDAGRVGQKQHTLDDVHAAARFLTDNNYTRALNLTLTGRSNGGMVTLASINQKPELFGAAIAGVPVADLLRFHKFTIGHAWVGDYGNPDNATQFPFIKKISPLHNIPDCLCQYPALLVTTADHDDRVVPSHSLKFIAELQYKALQTLEKHTQNGTNPEESLCCCTNSCSRTVGDSGKKLSLQPMLALVDTKAGHGAGKPVAKRIQDMVHQMCFLEKALQLGYDNSKFKNILKANPSVQSSQ